MNYIKFTIISTIGDKVKLKSKLYTRMSIIIQSYKKRQRLPHVCLYYNEVLINDNDTIQSLNIKNNDILIATDDKYIKIILNINNDSIKLCKIESKTPLSYLLKNISIKNSFMIYQGILIDKKITPETLELKDNCIIDVYY